MTVITILYYTQHTCVVQLLSGWCRVIVALACPFSSECATERLSWTLRMHAIKASMHA